MTTSSNDYITHLLQDPDIKGTIYETMLRNGIATQDPKIKFDAANSGFSNPFFQTQQDLGNEIKRIYGEQLGADKKEAKSGSDYAQKDYQSTIDTLNQGLTDETRSLSNKSASQGAFGNTAWQENQKSLANQYNTKFGSAYNTASRNADISGMKNQTNIGMGVQTPQFTQYNTQGATGQSYKYNPFQQAVGGVQGAQNYALNTLNYK